MELLRQQQAERPPIVLPDGSAFIVRQDDGKPVDPDGWSQKTFPALRRAARLPESITLHCLRHTYGSLLLADGAPIRLVSESMGHASVSITLDVYAHTLRATSSEATRALDKYIPSEKEKPGKPALRLVKNGAA